MTEKMFVDDRDDYAITTKPDECLNTSPDGRICRLDKNHDIYGYPTHKAIEIWEERRWSVSHYKWQKKQYGQVYEWETTT